MWQMDADNRFSLGSDEFTRLIGAHTAAGFGRPWSEIAEHFGLDPEGRIVKAIATRGTWSGITLDWPVDGGGRLPVELSGLPIYDYTGNLTGYRGFGICRDLDGLTRLDELRREELLTGAAAMHTAPADHVEAAAQDSNAEDSHIPDFACAGRVDTGRRYRTRRYMIRRYTRRLSPMRPRLSRLQRPM